MAAEAAACVIIPFVEETCAGVFKLLIFKPPVPVVILSIFIVICSPLFAPDAQRIYFQSDRHGKSAIYALHVERLVERIEEEGQ